MNTLAPSFLIGSYSYLQVNRTSIISRTSSEFGQIGPRIAELAAMKQHKLDKINKLRTIQSSDPKVYWKYLKSLQHNTKNTQPPLDKLYECFKNINQSEEVQDDVPNIN